jgi:hypothetical protein
VRGLCGVTGIDIVFLDLTDFAGHVNAVRWVWYGQFVVAVEYPAQASD